MDLLFPFIYIHMIIQSYAPFMRFPGIVPVDFVCHLTWI